MAQRLFMTGGTGFFGKSILDYRLRHPEIASKSEFTILSRDPDAFKRQWPRLAEQRGVGFVKGDVRSLSTKGIVSDGGSYDCILHFATSAVTTIPDAEQTSVIVDGARAVLDFAKATNTSRILFSSSGAVYGPQSAPVGEDSPCLPTTAYGKGKLEAERMLVNSGLDVRIARCFAFTGPYLNRRIHFAIGNFIEDALNGRRPELTGDGTPLRSYLYADDLVEWLLAIMERGETGRAYNVGSPSAISIRELADLVYATLTGNQSPVGEMRTEYRRPSVYVPKTLRAESELGLSVKVGLVEAVRRSADMV